MSTASVQGLRENKLQFSLLVLLTALVGSLIGLERSVFPQFAEQSFGISSASAMLSFITAFGISKAITNYFTGVLANKFGRRKLLMAGWVIALPVPILLNIAESWYVVVIANVILGISQGLAWSSAVVMKIDLVGEKNRGLAMGLNEFAGYLAVGIGAWISAYLAALYGIRPIVFNIGFVIAILGLLLTFFLIKDTQHYINVESTQSNIPELENVFIDTTFRHPVLGSITQAGLVNNLNDGMIWGLLPLLLLQNHLDSAKAAWIIAAYPLVWGVSQLFTGKLADHFSIRPLLFFGMLIQGFAIILLPFIQQAFAYFIITITLGIGTALVYPTFLTGVAQFTHPKQRAASLGFFRFWRDPGYAFGAIISGILVDHFGLTSAIISIGIITLVSAFILRMRIE